MGIRFPLKNIQVINDSGTSSVATGTIKTFTIPQDTDNILLKLRASITGGGVCAYLQTTDDGGTTWFDVGRTSIVSADGTNVLSQWMSAPVVSPGMAATSSSVVGKTATFANIGPAGASTLGVGQMSGMPILSTLNRVVLSYSAAGTSNTVAIVDIKVNSEAQND